MVFKQIGEDTDKLTKRIGLFSKSFSDIKKDLSNGLNIRQGLFSFVTDQDIKSLNEFNKAINDGAKYSDAFDTYLSKCPISVKRQANELIKLHTQQKILNQQLSTGKIKEEEYKTAMVANRVQTQALTTQTQALTFAQKASAVASKVMGTALKTALNIGLMLAINAIISGIIQLVNKQKELAESAKQSAQETSEYIDSLEGLKDKYLEIVDSENSVSEKTQELNKFKQELVETYGFEKDIIDKLNLSREHGIELLDEEAQKQAKAKRNEFYAQNKNVIDDAVDTIENTQSVEAKTTLVRPDELSKDILDKFSSYNVNTGFWGDYWTFDIDAKNIYDEYDKINEIIVDLQNRKDLNSSEQNFLNALINTSEEIKKIIDDYGETYQTYYEYKAQDLLEDYVAQYGDAANLTGRELENWKNGLYETADGNAALEESLESLIDKVYQFNEAETELSLSGTGISKNLSESLQTSLSEYEDQISDFLSEKDKIDSALKEQEENGSISASTAFELSKSGYKSAVKYDSETKAYKLLRSEINKTAESRIAETKAKLESEKASAIQSIKDETENWRKNTGRTKDDIMYLDKLDKNKVAINEISDAYDLYIRMLEYADEGTSEYADSISKVNEELEKQKTEIEKLDSGQSTIDKAIEEQKEFGHLSASSIKALHEAGLGTALAYNEATGETTLLIDSVEELYKAMIKAQEEAAKISLNNLATEIEEIENRLNNFSVNSAGDVEKKASLESDFAEKKSQYNTQQQNLQEISSYKFSFNSTSEDVQQSAEDAAEEYINSLKEAFEKEKNNLDYYLDMDMISQEEYYNQLTQLNEKYFKGKEEFLDEYRQYEVEVYKGLKQIQEEQINSIKEAFDKEKSELDHLNSMNAISQEEYYNRLFDLNEKYFKGKTELLDEYRQYEEEVYKGLKQVQIDAIQEQIDALKSVNEEKQEEIDLEKAKQALENAKRNKTISVYDSERGWIRETDRNAIDSAQQEYDDLVLNEKVEALENLIDAIENGTNTNHNLDESVNAFEQVKSITGQRVISGNVDLTQLFSGAVANRMNEIQNSINSNIPIALANQFDKSISSDSYTTNNNNTITLNGVTVMANNPEEFIAQMEDIANERFKENFPAAMNQFGRDLKRYQMNHSF